MSHLVRGAFLPNWVAVGEPACCSAGTLPDLAPQQNADGSCATYTVQPGDFCSLIASKNTITIDDIENFNTETGGWQGCGDVQLGQVIHMLELGYGNPWKYISSDPGFANALEGSPPMPVPLSNAICGPQVLGTAAPSNFSTRASLNPCPLNACVRIISIRESFDCR